MSSDSKSLVLSRPRHIAPSTVGEAKEFAILAAESAMLQPALRGKPADVFAILLTGMELGLGPMQALRSISIIQGRPSMDAALLVGLAKQNPRCEYFRCVESTSERAVYETRQKGSPESERSEYTMEDARREGLATKDNWRRMPAQMLRARASAALARMAYQDSVLGLVAREEYGYQAQDATDVEIEPAAEPEPPAPVVTPVVDAETKPIRNPAAPITGLDMKKFDGFVERMPPEMRRDPHPPGYRRPPQEVDFPVEESSEREKLLAEERKKKDANASEMHELANRVYPGEGGKRMRKEWYARWGLKQANPIKQFLVMGVEEQEKALVEARAWVQLFERTQNQQEMPDWPEEWKNKEPA